MKREEKGADCITREKYLEYLIHTYQNLIFSICLKSVGNPFDAEDLTQDVFLSKNCQEKSPCFHKVPAADVTAHQQYFLKMFL